MAVPHAAPRKNPFPTNFGDNHEQDEYTTTQYIFVVVSAIVIVLFLALMTRLPRNRGRNPWYHLGYVTLVIVSFFVIPQNVQIIVFSKVTIMVVGSVFPMYKSVLSVCSINTDDDKSWLQFWVAQGIFTFATAFLDDYHMVSNNVMYHWRQFLFFYLLWLLFPLTDGAALTFDYITKPWLAPIIQPMTKSTSSWAANFTYSAVNVVHLILAWMFFSVLPKSMKRFVLIIVGVTYPMFASIVAVTTERDDDDTFWLTYWSGYGLLFLVMDFLEDYMWKVPGFYSFFLLGTLYLLLPMTQGAERVFRYILVPLAGLQEELLVGDALRVKKDMIKKLKPHRVETVRKRVAASFAGDDSDLPDYLKTESYLNKTSKVGSSTDYGSTDEGDESKNPV